MSQRGITRVGATFLALFFVSGFAALLYQVVWQRMLTFFGGADVFAVTIIVAAFMGGLGFGSLAGGHLADRLGRGRALTAFAICEIAVALFAVFSAVIYYDLLYVKLGAWAPSRPALAAIIFVVTLWPTFFMGMSLPLLAAALTVDARAPARWIPLLYGCNTLGAAFGSLFASAILFRTTDFVSSVRVGAAFSFACGLAALLLAPRLRRAVTGAVADELPGTARDSLTPAPPTGFTLRTWALIYALSGFVALSLEILWFRVLGVILKSNSFTFGHLLAVYLLGLGAGALFGSAGRATAWPPVRAFLLLQAAIPVTAALSLASLVLSVDHIGWAEPLWRYLGEYETLSREALVAAMPDAPTQRGLFLLLYGVVPLALLGPPTLMMGLSFGHLQRAVQTDMGSLGRRVGWLQAANILGSMLGALLTGLLLLDWLGTAGTLRLLVCASAVFLWLYARVIPDRAGQRRAWGVAAGVCLLSYFLPGSDLMWARLHRADPADVIHAEDSSGLSLLKSRGGDPMTIVHANGLGQGILPYGGLHTVLGSLPALVHPRPAAVAVIGLGSGDTLFGIGGRSDTTTIDSIEIIAPQLATLRRLAAHRSYAGLAVILDDSRIHHWFTDGRAFIKKGSRRYDIIEADALRPTSAYAGNLFSVEYFELLRDALTAHGLAVTWVPTPRVLDSFITVFPHVVAFDDLAIGSLTPVPYDAVAIRARLEDPFTRDYYRRGGVDLPALLEPYLRRPPIEYGPAFDRTSLVDVNRDLFPRDEFAIGYSGRRRDPAASSPER